MRIKADIFFWARIYLPFVPWETSYGRFNEYFKRFREISSAGAELFLMTETVVGIPRRDVTL